MTNKYKAFISMTNEYVVIYYYVDPQGVSHRMKGYVYAKDITEAWEKAEEKFGKEDIHSVTQF